jgi:hypothetical protein
MNDQIDDLFGGIYFNDYCCPFHKAKVQKNHKSAQTLNRYVKGKPNELKPLPARMGMYIFYSNFAPMQDVGKYINLWFQENLWRRGKQRFAH